jgi:membrane protein required for colicin V production
MGPLFVVLDPETIGESIMSSWADWAVVAILVMGVVVGLAQGFFRSFCSLAGLFLGLVLAIWNYSYLGRVFLPVVRIEALANAIAFLVIAILVMLAAAALGGFLERTFRWAGLGCLDTFLGAVFGFLEGALMVMVIVLVTVAFFPGTVWLTEARLPPMFFGAAGLSMDMSPKDLSNQVQESLKKLKHESPVWLHPGHGVS